LCAGLKDRAYKTTPHTQQEQNNIRREISTDPAGRRSPETTRSAGELSAFGQEHNNSVSALALVSSYGTF